MACLPVPVFLDDQGAPGCAEGTPQGVDSGVYAISSAALGAAAVGGRRLISPACGPRARCSGSGRMFHGFAPGRWPPPGTAPRTSPVRLHHPAAIGAGYCSVRFMDKQSLHRPPGPLGGGTRILPGTIPEGGTVIGGTVRSANHHDHRVRHWGPGDGESSSQRVHLWTSGQDRPFAYIVPTAARADVKVGDFVGLNNSTVGTAHDLPPDLCRRYRCGAASTSAAAR